jgi:hypothetical protein
VPLAGGKHERRGQLNEQKEERRREQLPFYDAIVDRRERPAKAEPAMPGTVRPGYGEVPPPRERRQRPEAGME